MRSPDLELLWTHYGWRLLVIVLSLAAFFLLLRPKKKQEPVAPSGKTD
jgi:hypothetical protein